MTALTLLGATGSIGTSTLEVLAAHPREYSLYAAAAGRNVERMEEIVRAFAPRKVAMSDVGAARMLKERLRLSGLTPLPEILEGESGVCELARDPQGEYVAAAIVGAAGLKPVLEAARRGATIGLANKEALVMSGRLFFDTLKAHGAVVYPIDSEHSAIFQCLPESCQRELGACDLKGAGVRRILLTGSGGPFRNTPLEDLASVTAADAIRHPVWSMGPKISVDSATMMNKGLEYIEARYLFNATPEEMEIVIHPQSVVHSMVSFIDGAVLAQLGRPDMKTPIARALAYPERIAATVDPLDFTALSGLSFMAPDFRRYPCLRLAIEASLTGQGATTALNAANEVAVAAFLEGRIRYPDIYATVETVLSELPSLKAESLEEILDCDRQARESARKALGARKAC